MGDSSVESANVDHPSGTWGSLATAVDVAVLSPCATSSVLPFSFAGSLSGLYMALGAVDRSVGWHVDVCELSIEADAEGRRCHVARWVRTPDSGSGVLSDVLSDVLSVCLLGISVIGALGVQLATTFPGRIPYMIP